ncbi:MAG: propionyl-CoA synthetase [Bacteroidetes bacterium]|nr:MAG: propionyl-CoA synthetase [Bacteroidota bacterium]REK66675.1 MAG: propionyl-CoA synthetase [Bacteroidota bacterium]
MNTTYQNHFIKSCSQPDEFWMEHADIISWIKKPSIPFEVLPNGATKWFPDGELNTCSLCLDVHIDEGRGGQTAIIYESPVTNTVRSYTYIEVLREVNAVAKGMIDRGLQKGDAAIIYMPMIPEAVFTMLACARLGVIHSVVFGGFAPKELAVRLEDAKPKIIFTADAGIEIQKTIHYKPMVDAGIEISNHKPDCVVVLNRGLSDQCTVTNRDVKWENFINDGFFIPATQVASNDPLYILYTSGTTGKPKGIVRENGGHAVALKYSMEHIYGVKPGEVYWAASDIGWVVGHSYIVYGPMIHGATTMLFEGKPIKTPDASTFWRIISEHKVVTMFTAPTAIRAIRKEDPNGDMIKGYDLSHFRTQFLAGERCDADTLEWTAEKLGVPVIDHWWQTESGWPMLGQCIGYGLDPVKPGSANFPIPGYNVQIIDEQGQPAAPGEEGLVCVKLPLPPGALADLWQDTERFERSYLSPVPGYYFSGDGGYRDEEGYVFITGRVDDVINVAGHRLSTAEMEEVIAANANVAECACFGIHDELKGQVPMAMVVLNHNSCSIDELVPELKAAIRSDIGAIASIKHIIEVARLPKTRSGKILRKTLRAIVDGHGYQIPSTIDDPAILEEIEQKVKTQINTKTKTI